MIMRKLTLIFAKSSIVKTAMLINLGLILVTIVTRKNELLAGIQPYGTGEVLYLSTLSIATNGYLSCYWAQKIHQGNYAALENNEKIQFKLNLIRSSLLFAASSIGYLLFFLIIFSYTISIGGTYTPNYFSLFIYLLTNAIVILSSQIIGRQHSHKLLPGAVAVSSFLAQMLILQKASENASRVVNSWNAQTQPNLFGLIPLIIILIGIIYLFKKQAEKTTKYLTALTLTTLILTMYVIPLSTVANHRTAICTSTKVKICFAKEEQVKLGEYTAIAQKLAKIQAKKLNVETRYCQAGIKNCPNGFPSTANDQTRFAAWLGHQIVTNTSTAKELEQADWNQHVAASFWVESYLLGNKQFVGNVSGTADEVTKITNQLLKMPDEQALSEIYKILVKP